MDVEFRREGNNLGVVTICATLGHDIQTQGKGSADVGFRRRGRVEVLSQSTSILPFWVASNATARIGNDESFEVFGMLPHIFDRVCTKLGMLALIPIHLIRESVKETIACDKN